MDCCPDTLAWVQRILDDPTMTVVFHNGKFDLKMFSRMGVKVLDAKAKVHCTLILSKLYNERGQHDLHYLSIKYIPNRDTADKLEVIQWVKSNQRRFKKEYGRPCAFSDAPRDMVKRRALWDVESTLMLFHFLHPRVIRDCAELYETERQLMFVVVDMETTGVRVDITRAKELKAEAEKAMQQIQQDLDKLICPITIKKKHRGAEVEQTLHTFNANSNKQLIAAFEKVGIELRFKTKPKKIKKGPRAGQYSGGGNWSFDEYAMIRYVSKPLQSIIRDSGEEGWEADRFYKAVCGTIVKEKLPERELLPPLILRLREAQKMISTYYSHIIEDTVDVHTERDGREYGTLYCNFNQSEAMTGRFSSSKPNLQNMPRLLGPRECFVPRIGRRNWHFDYKQVEMKFFAHFAKDPDMARMIDKDVHLFVATQIYGIAEAKVTKEQRKRAKAINFGILYGAGPEKIAETLTSKGLPTSAQEATILVARYHRRFPSIRKLSNQLKIDLARHGFVTNAFGRRYRIKSKEAYTAINYICQGTSADMIKRAMVKIWHLLRAIASRAKLIVTIHDEVVIEIPRSEERSLPSKILQVMEDRTSFFVPITCDAEVVTKRWSEKTSPEKLGLRVA